LLLLHVLILDKEDAVGRQSRSSEEPPDDGVLLLDDDRGLGEALVGLGGSFLVGVVVEETRDTKGGRRVVAGSFGGVLVTRRELLFLDCEAAVDVRYKRSKTLSPFEEEEDAMIKIPAKARSILQ
jgi:hypothetical protein